MQDVGVVAECDAGVRRALVDVDVLVNVHHILPLRIDLDQDLPTAVKQEYVSKYNSSTIAAR